MTVSSTTTKVSHSGDGSTTAFSYTFKIFATSELKVYIRSSAGAESLKTLDTHYTVSGAGEASGGNVTFTSGNTPAATETVVIIRDTPNTQSLDLVENDPFLSSSFEDSLDKITHQVIELEEEVARSFKVSKTNSITSAEFTDSAANRASKTLGFDSSGDLTVVADFLPAGGDSSQFTYSTTTTDSDPGSGIIRFNNTTFSSITYSYVDDLESNGTDVSAWLQSFDDVTGNASNRGRLRVSKSNSLAVWAVFRVSGAVTDASGYTKIPLVYIDGAGTFTNEDKVFLSFTASGEDGAIPGYYYKFDTGTSKADPGSGEISFNNGTYASVTKICISDSDSNSGSTSTDVLTWDDGTSSPKGILHIVDINDSSTYARFNITGSTSDESGYNELTVTHAASNNTFSSADELSVNFTRHGNTGATGATGAAGATGIKLTWETSTGDSDQGAGKIWGNNGTFSSISYLYFDDVNTDGTNIEAWIQTFDDSTHTALRGTIYIEESGTNSQFGVFSVTGAVVDGTGYWKVPVSHVASNVGSLADGDTVGVVFSRTGNKGADGTGDIEGVTAGTNLSGGGTSGTVTINLADASTSAKGAASFSSDNFAASSGAITIKDQGVALAEIVNVTATDKVLGRSSSGAGTIEEISCTSAGRALLDDANASAQRTTLGVAYGKNTVYVPAAAMYPNTTAGCAALAQVELSNGPEIKVLDFDASSDENAQFTVAFPKSWNESTVTFQAFFTVTGTNTGTVAWGLSGVALADNDSINTAFGTNVVATAKAHSGTSNDLDVSAESGTVTIAGSPSVDELVYFQVMRDVSADSQTGDARLLGIKLFFTNDAGNDT